MTAQNNKKMSIIEVLNNTTETLSKYTMRLIQIETALCTYDLNLVQIKSDEIKLFEMKLQSDIQQINSVFESTFHAPFSTENMKLACSRDINLKNAYDNFMTMINAALAQLNVNDKLNEQTFEAFESVIPPKMLDGESSQVKGLRRRKHKRSKE
ncbi:hypothetical protein [Photobacterium kishitanii]|nr:hypothetical protein [Photobacterium kishitanii]